MSFHFQYVQEFELKGLIIEQCLFRQLEHMGKNKNKNKNRPSSDCYATTNVGIHIKKIHMQKAQISYYSTDVNPTPPYRTH